MGKTITTIKIVTKQEKAMLEQAEFVRDNLLVAFGNISILKGMINRLSNVTKAKYSKYYARLNKETSSEKALELLNILECIFERDGRHRE